MKRMEFCEKWIHWIMTSLSSSSVSMLVIDNPIMEFQPKRGLREGDPLVPFLFTCAEGLSGLMREVVKKNMFSGYGVRKEKVNISLLQYVEDTIFFGMPTLSNALIIKSIMKCYELVSRLKVNFIKSRYVSVGIPNSMVERFIGLLNCKILVINFVHLGISIGENLRKDSTWRPIVEKIVWKFIE